MKRRNVFGIAILTLVLTAFPTTALAQEGTTVDPIEGVWLTSDGEGWVEIRRENGSLTGTIIGGPNGGDRRDEHNPDPALRDRRLTGLTILQGFEADEGGKWTGGTIYDPDNGKTYRCNLQLENKDRLKVRGYLGVSLFGRTEMWTRRADG